MLRCTGRHLNLRSAAEIPSYPLLFPDGIRVCPPPIEGSTGSLLQLARTRVQARPLRLDQVPSGLLLGHCQCQSPVTRKCALAASYGTCLSPPGGHLSLPPQLQLNQDSQLKLDSSFPPRVPGPESESGALDGGIESLILPARMGLTPGRARLEGRHKPRAEGPPKLTMILI
jgi:hypothetical protein